MRAGIQSFMNGNRDDASNLNNTFLRGIQQTDSDGVVQFSTIFPGHCKRIANPLPPPFFFLCEPNSTARSVVLLPRCLPGPGRR